VYAYRHAYTDIHAHIHTCKFIWRQNGELNESEALETDNDL